MSPINKWRAFLHGEKHTMSPPPSTTPNADYRLRTPLWMPIAKIGAVIAVPLIVLSIYGQPALRIKYTWNGNAHSPVYFKCDYLTLFDGWKRVEAGYGTHCPLIGFVPVDISKLLFS